MNYYLYFTNKDRKDIFKGLTQFLLIFVFLEKLIKNMDMLEKGTGLCFSSLFCSIIITTVLHQWPKSLVHDVMVSGLDFFQNPSLVVVTLSSAMEVFNPRAKGNHCLSRVQCLTCVRQCYGP